MKKRSIGSGLCLLCLLLALGLCGRIEYQEEQDRQERCGRPCHGSKERTAAPQFRNADHQTAWMYGWEIEPVREESARKVVVDSNGGRIVVTRGK